MYIYNLGQQYQHIAQKHKNKAAIAFIDGTQITFGQLEIFSNQIANFLISKGLKKQQVIAIQNNKTPFGFSLMLACLKLGIIYTNFDVSNPLERLEKIFELAEPVMVFGDCGTTTDVTNLCQKLHIPCLEYSNTSIRNAIKKQPKQLSKDRLNSISGENPAYIMFTSGSTGVPKGVLIKHESILNFIHWGKEAYALADDDILTNVNPIYFDNSVFDFYCSIFNGLTMATFPLNVVSQPKMLLELVEQAGCTFWFSVPSFLIYLTNIRLLTKDVLKTIRTFTFGGEGYPKELLKKLFDLYAHRARFFNVYGPTEGTCICSAHEISEADFSDDDTLVTLGRLAPNFDCLILDEHNKESNIGELCLIGPQLALGYYNDPERTAQSFVLNPLNKLYGQKMYRTGDLVEKRDGRLYFKGRADNQIKHMGYRIELEEIEAGLIKLPYIRQCAVVHGKTDAGFSRLIAYIATDVRKEQKELREGLRQYLPDYMIPNTFEFMDDLPKNPNGKVDRVRLKFASGLS
ncbi:amino acid adenylation domain-containing protein [Oxalobacter sp. OttesenSCG-928-P03]|nr:amino acid adenylation domain-containing protein [Oxalobacter sp. OttesenSCG-928-P03]